MPNNKEYAPINLPKTLVAELKIWRKALAARYPTKDVTNETMIRSMIDAFGSAEPAVRAEYERITKAIEKEENV